MTIGRSTSGHSRSSGIGMVELAITVAMLSVLLCVGFANIQAFYGSVDGSTDKLLHFIKSVREEAMSSSKSLKVVAKSTNTLSVSRANTCGSTDWSSVSELELRLDTGVVFQTDKWEICYNSRGVADVSFDIVLSDEFGRTNTVEVLLGGSVGVVD